MIESDPGGPHNEPNPFVVDFRFFGGNLKVRSSGIPNGIAQR